MTGGPCDVIVGCLISSFRPACHLLLFIGSILIFPRVCVFVSDIIPVYQFYFRETAGDPSVENSWYFCLIQGLIFRGNTETYCKPCPVFNIFVCGIGKNTISFIVQLTNLLFFIVGLF